MMPKATLTANQYGEIDAIITQKGSSGTINHAVLAKNIKYTIILHTGCVRT